MSALAATTLTQGERAVLERFAKRLQARFGSNLRAVWLFGSAARGEYRPPVESDVDVLVIVEGLTTGGSEEVRSELHAGAKEIGHAKDAWAFSVHVDSPEWLAGRRAVKSFFMAEVDRDKVVVVGEG